MKPSLPTAHTSSAPLPPMPCHDCEAVSGGADVHLVPSQCCRAPVAGATHTSLGPLPQMPWIVSPVKARGLKFVPVPRYTRPIMLSPVPTSHVSFVPEP